MNSPVAPLSSKEFSSRVARSGERGSALLIAIALLAIMAIFGMAMLSVSTTEIRLSSNFEQQQQTLAAANRAIAVAITKIKSGAFKRDLELNVYDGQEELPDDLIAIRTSIREAASMDGSILDPDYKNEITFRNITVGDVKRPYYTIRISTVKLAGGRKSGRSTLEVVYKGQDSVSDEHGRFSDKD